MINWKNMHAREKSDLEILMDEYEKKFGVPYVLQFNKYNRTEAEEMDVVLECIRSGKRQELEDYDLSGGKLY